MCSGVLYYTAPCSETFGVMIVAIAANHILITFFTFHKLHFWSVLLIADCLSLVSIFTRYISVRNILDHVSEASILIIWQLALAKNCATLSRSMAVPRLMSYLFTYNSLFLFMIMYSLCPFLAISRSVFRGSEKISFLNASDSNRNNSILIAAYSFAWL